MGAARVIKADLFLAAVSLSILAAVASAQAIPDLGFTTRVTAGLTASYTRKFGPPVPQRLTRWAGFAKEHGASWYSIRLESGSGRETDALQVVNDAINGHVKWIPDAVHWGAEDYWATPAESVASAGGDCEDYAIAKYYLLKELGVPLERLRITYVRARTLNGQPHMVLAYYAQPDADPLILDNLDVRVRPASRRSDLEPEFSFNDDDVRHVRDGRTRNKPSQIRVWLDLQQRLVAETRL